MASIAPEPEPERRRIIVGVDTHKHAHAAVAVDEPRSRLGECHVQANSGGYAQLEAWALWLGRPTAFGVEGTGSYGVGLASWLRRSGHRLVEVNRGDRRSRRTSGKTDTLDAEAAARSVLWGEATAVPKSADGAVEMIRQVEIARDTARKGRTSAMRRPQGSHRHRPGRAARAVRRADRQGAHRPLRRPAARNHRHPGRVRQARPAVPGETLGDP